MYGHGHMHVLRALAVEEGALLFWGGGFDLGRTLASLMLDRVPLL